MASEFFLWYVHLCICIQHTVIVAYDSLCLRLNSELYSCEVFQDSVKNRVAALILYTEDVGKITKSHLLYWKKIFNRCFLSTHFLGVCVI